MELYNKQQFKEIHVQSYDQIRLNQDAIHEKTVNTKYYLDKTSISP